MKQNMNAVAIVVLLSSACFLGCVTSHIYTYRDAELPKHRNENPDKQLSLKEVKADRDQLIYILEHAYSGSKYLIDHQFERLVSDLKRIESPETAKVFCAQVAEALSRVSDAHSQAYIKGLDAPCFPTHERTPQVGKNYFHPAPEAKNLVWDVHQKRFHHKKILMISILTLPGSKDSVWNGFLEKIKSNLKTVDVIIVDLRGNGGGSDSMGFRLAELLAGRKVNAAYAPQRNIVTPESMQVQKNEYYLSKLSLEAEHKPVEPYLNEIIDHFEKFKQLAIIGKAPSDPWEGIVVRDEEKEPLSFDIKKSIQKPIYILMDANCGSSCESSIDAFESNPLVKRVGENTAGYIHFGNEGIAVLWNSGVTVQMAMSFNSYRDGRFVEKTGITPNLQTPKGRDALDTALADYWKNQR